MEREEKRFIQLRDRLEIGVWCGLNFGVLGADAQQRVPTGLCCNKLVLMVLVVHEPCLFCDVFPGIFFVVIEMSIFCGCEFFYHPFDSSLEDTEVREREEKDWRTGDEV